MDKKRYVPVFVALVMIVSALFPLPSAGLDQPAVWIDPSSQTVNAGDTFTIEVKVDATGYSLTGIDVEVNFDPNVMSVSSATGNNLLDGMEIGPEPTDSNGYYYALASPTPVSNVTGTLLTLEFTVASNALSGEYELGLSVQMADQDGNPISPISVTPGTVTVVGVALPSVAFSSSTYQVNEGAGTATIEVVLSQATTQTVTVEYATSDGTATAEDDYITTSGTLEFAPGETVKTFTVTIVDDGLVEGDETINLTLSNPSNATLGTPSTAVLTIIDDDTAPQVVATTPQDGAIGVPVDVSITATFNKDMEANTITPDTFLLEDAAGNPVAGGVSYDAGTRTAIFTPADDLDYGTTYTATLTTEVKDTFGNSLPSDYSWSFTTEAAPEAGVWAEPSMLGLAGLGPRVKEVVPDTVQVVVAGETVEVDVAEFKNLMNQYEERLPEGYGTIITTLHVTTTEPVDGVTLNLEQFLRSLFPDGKMQEVLGDAYSAWDGYLGTLSSEAMQGSATDWSYEFNLFQVFDYLMKWSPQDSGLLEFNKAGVAKFGQILSALVTGRHTIPVMVTKDGEVVVETQIELSVVDFVYALRPGWSTVAIPLLPTANSMNVQGMLAVSGLEFGLGKDIDSIVRWNAEEQRWEQYAIGIGGPGWYDGGALAAEDTTVPALEALFVHSPSANKSLGIIFSPAGRNVAYQYLAIAAEILGGGD